MANLLELLGLKSDAEPAAIKTSYDRLKPAAYTSPSGVRTEMRYSSALEKSFAHKLDSYTYNGINGALIQDLGTAGDTYPMVWYLAGNDYDKESLTFETSLRETGVGTLEHPVYGRKRVVVGSVRRQDDPINGGGIGAFTIDFRETLEFTPEGAKNATEVSETKLEAANDASVNEFANVALDVLGDVIKFKDDVLGALNTIANVLDDVISASSDAIVLFNQIKRDIETNINTIINFPETLARQIQIMTQLTTTSGGGASETLIALGTLTSDVTNYEIIGASQSEINRSLISELIVGACINSAAIVVQDNSYETKTATFEALDTIQAFLVNATQLVDEKQTGFNGNIFEKQYFSQLDSFQAIMELVNNVKTDLQLRAFDSKLERGFVAGRDYQILELCSLLYNAVDDATIDFFIDTNSFEDDEFIIVPAGRNVVFYV
jgi:hypothetical protein